MSSQECSVYAIQQKLNFNPHICKYHILGKFPDLNFMMGQKIVVDFFPRNF